MTTNQSNPQDPITSHALEVLAKTLGVAVENLWQIFNREYVVKGAIQILVGGFLLLLYLTLNLPLEKWIYIRLPLLIPMVFFLASGLRYALNPGYYALEDIMAKIKEIKGI